MSTIFAPCTGAGRSAVRILRLSGPLSVPAARALCPRLPDPLPSRRVLSAPLCHGGVPLDRALLLHFAAPRSLTGEDVVELHVHGGAAVLRGVFAALSALARDNRWNLRPALPGEFLRRGFENGKVDLVEVEGVADLIEAETEAQRVQALEQIEGKGATVIRALKEDLKRAAAHLEAFLEFGDEEDDVGEDVLRSVAPAVEAVRGRISGFLSDHRRGSMIREGVRVVILGAPNAGKSSLLNELSRREAAIVSEVPGTTRDVVQVTMDIGGVPVIFADTAGIRDTTDVVETEGIKRALAWSREADVRLMVVDQSALDPQVANALGEQGRSAKKNGGPQELNGVLREGLLRSLPEHFRDLLGPETVLVLNKVDLPPRGDVPPSEAPPVQEREGCSVLGVCVVSCRAPTRGIDSLLDCLQAVLQERLLSGENSLGTATVISRERHRHHLQQGLDFLSEYERMARSQGGIVLAAESLRLAIRSLGAFTGEVHTEDILDIVFRDFCIGK